MKLNLRRQFAQVALFSLMALGAGSAFAQTERAAPGLPSPTSPTGIQMEAQGQNDSEPQPTRYQPLVVAPEFVSPGQGRGGSGGQMPCKDVVINQLAPSPAASPYLPDFNAAFPPNVGFNATMPNQRFGHTFTLRAPGKCCQCAGGRLTVVYKALQDGASATSADAGNDLGGLVSGGASVPGSVGPIWGGPVKKDTTKTIVYDVPCKLISTGRVSLSAQDDTAVVSARLEIRGCCAETNW